VESAFAVAFGVAASQVWLFAFTFVVRQKSFQT
jgi:hypothetical protein